MEVRCLMNKKEELKAHIIKCCVDGNMTIKQAANRLGFSERYVKKLKSRYKNMVFHPCYMEIVADNLKEH